MRGGEEGRDRNITVESLEVTHTAHQFLMSSGGEAGRGEAGRGGAKRSLMYRHNQMGDAGHDKKRG